MRTLVLVELIVDVVVDAGDVVVEIVVVGLEPFSQS